MYESYPLEVRRSKFLIVFSYIVDGILDNKRVFETVLRTNRLLTLQKKMSIGAFSNRANDQRHLLEGGKKYTFRSSGNFNRRFFVFSNKIFFFPLDISTRKDMFYHRVHRTVSLQLYPRTIVYFYK